jgi:uncharacterized repeat protein (TIGR02543 family)
MKLRKLLLSLIGISILVTCNSYAPIVITDYQMKATWPANPEALVVFKSYSYSFLTGEGSYASIRLYTVPAGFIDTTAAAAAITGKSGSVYFVKAGSCKLYIEGTTSEGGKITDSLVNVTIQNPFKITGKTILAVQEHGTLSLTPAPTEMAPQAQVIWKVNGAASATAEPAAAFDFASGTVGSFAVSATIADAGQKNMLQLDATTVTVQLKPVATFAVNVGATNGTVAKFPDKPVYDSNSVVGLKATAAGGYHFVNWSGDISGTSDSIGVTVSGVKNITANFEANVPGKFALSVTAANGSVTKTPDLTQYDSGSTVKLKAVPNAGYHFVNWGGDASGAIDTVTILMNGKKSVTANFATNPVSKYVLTVSATNGTVTKTPDNTQYDSGTVVGLKAHPGTGYHFVNWSGDATGTSDTIAVTVTDAKSIVANFEKNAVGKFPLAITAANGTVVKTPDNSQYDSGSTVKLKAVPSAGYHFVNWGGDASGTADSASVVMTAAKSVTANFAANPVPKYTLTVSATGGSVTRSPDNAQYDSGSTVKLKAVPSAGYHFVNWGGDASGTADSASVVMTAAKSVTAHFAANPIPKYTLTVSATNGAVNKTPDNAQYDSGSTVRLKAIPLGGYHFVNWTGAATGTSDSIAVLMNGNKTITANFEANVVGKFTLSITAANGSVVKTPDQTQYDSGSTVRLKAAPAMGYRFVNWGGAASGTTDSVSIVMAGNKSVSANFSIVTYALSATASNGVITKYPDKTQYDSGSVVGVKVRANSGYRFTGWSGDASGSADSIGVVMTGTKTIVAKLIAQFTLKVTATNGTVAKSPDLAQYDSGAIVQLAPTASAGFHFGSWGGDATGTAQPLNVTMTSAKNIIANFVRDTFTVMFILDAGNPNGKITGTTIQKVASGDSTTTVTAIPNGGYKFSGWTGSYNGSSNPLTIKSVTGNLTVTANFVPICQWTAMSNGMTPGTSIFALATNGANVFASMNNGIYKSMDNGTNWSFLDGSPTYVGAMAVSQGNLVAAGGGGSVKYSTDNGSSWKDSDLYDNIYSFVINGNKIYGSSAYTNGFDISTNGGVNWTSFSAGIYAFYAIALQGSAVFIGGSSGVFRTMDNGSTWTPVNSGLPVDVRIGDKALVSSGGILLTGPQASGVYKSTDNGDSWSSANTGLPNGCSIKAFIVYGSNIFAGTDKYGVYVTSDNGANWTAVNSGISNNEISNFALNGSYIFVGTGAGVFRSALP